MRYKITEKIVYCELRCSSQGNVFNCLECKQHVGEIGEKTKILTEKLITQNLLLLYVQGPWEKEFHLLHY